MSDSAIERMIRHFQCSPFDGSDLIADEATWELADLRRYEIDALNEIKCLRADLRRRAQGVDVEAVVREVRATIAAWTHPGMSDHDRSVVVEQALRRALARETGASGG